MKPKHEWGSAPDGYWLEPVLRWFPGWKSSLTARTKRDLRLALIGSAASANREAGIRNGESWATGYLGQMSAKPAKLIDVGKTRMQTIAGVRHTPTKRKRAKT